MKTTTYTIENNLTTREAKQLTRAFALLNSPEEVLRLFRDLLTVDEVEEFSRRLEAARLLSEGKTYREVASQTGMSTATVTRISRWLHHGTGGYRHVLQELRPS